LTKKSNLIGRQDLGLTHYDNLVVACFLGTTLYNKFNYKESQEEPKRNIAQWLSEMKKISRFFVNRPVNVESQRWAPAHHTGVQAANPTYVVIS